MCLKCVQITCNAAENAAKGHEESYADEYFGQHDAHEEIPIDDVREEK
jgi:hypothetical protein